MIQYKTQTTLQKHLMTPTQLSKYTTPQQKFLTMFNFQLSQITQQEFEQLAVLLFNYPIVYDTSQFDLGIVNSPLHLPLKLDAFFKKRPATKVPINLQHKINTLFDILFNRKLN